MADKFIIMQGIAIIVIAAITVYIAYQQWKTNRDKLRLSIFDKRFSVFIGLMKLHVYILQHVDASTEALNEFKLVYLEGQFLFDNDIAEHLDNVYNQAVELQANKELLSAEGLQPDVKRNVNTRNYEITQWFLENFKQEKSRFKKYLRFK